jgi:hypothetical protein
VLQLWRGNIREAQEKEKIHAKAQKFKQKAQTGLQTSLRLSVKLCVFA